VAFGRWARRRGLSSGAAAACLDLPARTLRYWEQHWRLDHLAPEPQGRRPARSDRPRRNAVLAFLEVTGPAVPFSALRAQFPQIPRAELKRLLRRYRRQCRRERQPAPRRLYWFEPGSVWAMDFVELSGDLPDGLRWVLSVRDLASRYQLLWRPMEVADAAGVVTALTDLFQEHGPPLVLKSDNGAPFIAEQTLALLERHEVLPLFSPPRRPQYNGACERAGAILKGYTWQAAVQAGRAGVLQAQDLEQAHRLANDVTRPWGHRGPSPNEVWQQRPPLGHGARRAFRERLARHRRSACELLGYTPGQVLRRAQRAKRDRRAAPRTLEESGYLAIVERGHPLLRRPPCGPRASALHGASDNSRASPPPSEQKPCTLTIGSAAGDRPRPAIDQATPAHREPDLFSVPRRSLTPPHDALKPANIP
jgi:transposase InsO family protein